MCQVPIEDTNRVVFPAYRRYYTMSGFTVVRLHTHMHTIIIINHNLIDPSTLKCLIMLGTSEEKLNCSPIGKKALCPALSFSHTVRMSNYRMEHTDRMKTKTQSKLDNVMKAPQVSMRCQS